MPRVSFLSIVSEPSGVQVYVDGSLVTTPVHVLSWENQNLLIGVEDQDNLKFREWSNGKERQPKRQHFVLVPPGDDPTLEITAYLESTPSDEEAPSSLPTEFPDIISLVRPVRKDCSPSNPCGRCEGHCRSDAECGDGLVCFYKDRGVRGKDSVPGCSGHDLSLTDWCTIGSRSVNFPIKLVKPATNSCSKDKPCGRCEGKCKADDDCENDLVCFQKDRGVPGYDSVPGCIGESLGKVDWCTTANAIASLLPLVKTDDCTSETPCGECEDRCKYVDCGEGLICFYKDAGEGFVPGCAGSDESARDWCIAGVRSKEEPIPLVKPTSNTYSKAKPCGRCEGRCRNDKDCAGDLICFQKDRGIPGFDSVPGCIGESLSKADWCTTRFAVEVASAQDRNLRGRQLR